MSNVKMKNNIKRVNFYLFKEAIARARDSYQLTLLKGLELSNLSPADQDMLNILVFGESHPEATIDLRTLPPLSVCTQERLSELIAEKSREFSGLWD